MVDTKVRREPVLLRVRKQDFPNFGQQKCKFCEVGTFEKRLIEYKREVDYDEAWVTVILRELPAAVCNNCGAEVVLDSLLDSLDPIVGDFLEASLNERDPSIVSFDESLVELITS